MDLFAIAAIVVFLVAAILSAIQKGWVLALIGLGLALAVITLAGGTDKIGS